ncbi:MAG: hypothetical protein M1827_000386 [Pycnora praestabilis]|nr:MAG: hypothetical protein M1827_000386 [Pycnora praestabilis]
MDLQFITVETDPRGEVIHNRHMVRSHVTKGNHRRQKLERTQKRRPSRPTSSAQRVDEFCQCGSVPLSFCSVSDIESSKETPPRTLSLASPAENVASASLNSIAKPQSTISSAKCAQVDRSVNGGRDNQSEDQSQEQDSTLSICGTCGRIASSSQATGKTGRKGPNLDRGQLSQLAKPRLVTYLGSGRMDPFRSLPADCMSSGFDELINFAVSYVYPTLLPVDDNGNSNPLASSWLPKSMETPFMFHALMYAAFAHLAVLRGRISKTALTLPLYCRGEAIRQLNVHLSDAAKSTSDEVILTILAIARNDMKEGDTFDSYTPFQSPLTSAGCLNSYGKWTCPEVHARALIRIVTLRGGLEKLELTGLARSISNSDILYATRGFSKPFFPSLKCQKPPNGCFRTFDDTFYPTTLHNLGRSFSELRKYGFDDQIIALLYDMCHHTITLDSYCRGTLLRPNLRTMVDRRNVIQHRILSLPHVHEVEGPLHGDYIYESFRLTMLIYSIAVIYPVPPFAGVREKLVQRLQPALRLSDLISHWGRLSGALTWVLVMGGIAASGMPERTWFTETLASLSAAVGIDGWEDVKDILTSFIWLESACELGGRVLWVEVEELKRLGADQRKGLPLAIR